jgi:hypothetical protein
MKETLALEVLENYLSLNNSPKVLEATIEIFRERGKKKDANILENVLDDLRTGRKDILDSFYEYKLIKDDTYSFLSSLKESSMLTANLVKDVKERKEFIEKVEKEIKNAYKQPIAGIILAFSVGWYVNKQAFALAKAVKYQFPDIFILHKWLVSSPLIAIPITLAVIIAGALYFTKLTINARLGKKQKLYEISSIAEILMKAKQPLRKIFLLLAEFEKNKKWKALFIEIAERYTESFRKQIEPLIKFLGEFQAIKFIVLAERDSVESWKFLKEDTKFNISQELIALKDSLVAIMQMFLWLVIFIISAPLFVIIINLLSKVQF